MPKKNEIKFLLIANLKGVMFNPARKEGLKFNSISPLIDISIIPEDDSGFGQLKCRLKKSIPTTADYFKFVSALNERRYLPLSDAPLVLPYVVNGAEKVDATGKIKEGVYLAQDALPRKLQEFCKEAESELKGSLQRFLNLLRWRQDHVSSHLEVDYTSIYWKTKTKLYHHVPSHQSEITKDVERGITWEVEDRKKIRKLWRKPEIYEPLSHELLREAITLYGHSPRSALLCAVSALEVGVKQHINNVVPKAGWLIFEAPSPPMHKILNHYFPELHEETGVVEWDKLKPLFKVCSKSVEVRNKVAHKGEIVSNEEVGDYIAAIHDVLYIIDVLEGHEWAKSLLLNHVIRKSLGWPNPEHRRMTVTISSCSV